VNIGVDGPAAPVVNAGIDLARRFDAVLIGFCAADMRTPSAVPVGGSLAVDAWQRMRDDLEARFEEARREFDRLAAGTIKTQWRSHRQNPTQALIDAARLADLVVMAAAERKAGEGHRIADPASVVLHAGRPLLVIAGKAERLATKAITVAWKDTREARRAVADAVPLLAEADEVTVVTVAAKADRALRQSVDDVASYLASHGAKARAELVERADEVAGLLDFIVAARPDLVVSGAYGHSRLREWAFGGVTRSLLDEAGLNRLMSS
jgi:nucleotide-binding universal stress UspA family protein